jgi:signal transduction histidine kinase
MGIFGLTMGSISFCFSVTFPPKIGGLFAWGASMTSVGLAFLLFMLRGTGTPFVTYYLANSLSILSLTFGSLAFIKFYNEFYFERFAYSLCVLSLVLIAGHYYYYGIDFNSFRVFLVSGAGSLFLGINVYLVVKNHWRKFGVSSAMTSLTFGFFAIVMGYRALNVVVGQPSTSQLFSRSGLNFTFFALVGLVIVAASIGFLLLATERLIQEVLEQTLKAQNARRLAALGEMASGVAHEINNPLSVIRLSLGLLKIALKSETKGIERNEKTEELFVKLFKSVDRVASIVRGLTAFSRQKDGEPAEIESIHKIIENTLDLCEAKFSIKSVKILIDVPSQIRVTCRPNQISQIIFNLLSNGFEAVNRHEVKEKVISIQGIEKDGFVYISFTDTGVGISVQDREKLFRPFFTTREVGSGTGLGLSIALGIAKEHGGDLIFDEKQIKTTFTLKLPTADVSPILVGKVS